MNYFHKLSLILILIFSANTAAFGLRNHDRRVAVQKEFGIVQPGQVAPLNFFAGTRNEVHFIGFEPGLMIQTTMAGKSLKNYKVASDSRIIGNHHCKTASIDNGRPTKILLEIDEKSRGEVINIKTFREKVNLEGETSYEVDEKFSVYINSLHCPNGPAVCGISEKEKCDAKGNCARVEKTFQSICHMDRDSQHLPEGPYEFAFKGQCSSN